MHQKCMKTKVPQAEKLGPSSTVQIKSCNVFPPLAVGPAVIASRLHFHSPALIWIFQPQIVHCFPPRCSNLFYPHISFVNPAGLGWIHSDAGFCSDLILREKVKEENLSHVAGGLVDLTTALCHGEISTDYQVSAVTSHSFLKPGAEDVSD